MKKGLIITLTIGLALYTLLCIFLYYFQESMIFFPEKLTKTYQFQFDQDYEEKYIKTSDGIVLNGLLFKSNNPNPKGLIFYLHGNAGSLKSWGGVAETYTDLNYDIFILDYRGYGKSEGQINGQKRFFEDIQNVYDELKKEYKEEAIIVLGYSIGTGLASKIASTNNPKLLILQAPYYSLVDMMQHTYPIIPPFILKYKFETHNYLKNCKMPLVIFHGNQDKVIYYGSSLKLKKAFKKSDILITLNKQGHNGMTDNKKYKAEIKKILIAIE